MSMLTGAIEEDSIWQGINQEGAGDLFRWTDGIIRFPVFRSSRNDGGWEHQE